jgi:flavin reductase (DIM6/NTAB) family NADH-FMN oxidoreductase RutF
MKACDPIALADTAIERIRDGAFLIVKAGTHRNIMTIGWALIGIMWAKPVMTIAVRTSRHTFGIIENAADFSVSIPSGDMKSAIAFCGSTSGKDRDKFKESGLQVQEGKSVFSPVIKTPGIHFECEIVYKSPINPAALAPKFLTVYPLKDYHTLYFGEIVECYEL